MFTNEQIGRRLESRRLELNLTMQEVASRVGVARSTVQRYEKGKISKIKLPVIESFAAALSVNPSWLIGKTEDKCVVRTESGRSVISLEVRSLSNDVLTQEESELLRKFRSLDSRGKSAVWNVLNHEFESLPGEKANSASKEA